MKDWLKKLPHRRFNILTGEWVLVSPHRINRPWSGQKEQLLEDIRLRYDPDCYLCPGNKRASGQINPDYQSTFVFKNDFPALLETGAEKSELNSPLFQSCSVLGECLVVCFSPRHDLTLAEMKQEEIKAVIDVWAEESRKLGETFLWVQVFENKGKMMGCSNPHPHGQIWASNFLPALIEKEDRSQKNYYLKHGDNLLLSYAREEASCGERVVVASEDWLVVVPFWAYWPYETLVLPRKYLQRFPDLSESQKESLAIILKRLLVRYDNLFQTSFPYSMGWHGAPFEGSNSEAWQLHAHFYPPLLRSATVKKYMAGYELLAEVQRDITPEQAAEYLRQQPEKHYREL